MTLSRRRYLRSDLYSLVFIFFFFFFNDTATTEIYTLSLHDALPVAHRLGHEPRVLPGEAKGGDRAVVLVLDHRRAEAQDVRARALDRRRRLELDVRHAAVSEHRKDERAAFTVVNRISDLREARGRDPVDAEDRVAGPEAGARRRCVRVDALDATRRGGGDPDHVHEREQQDREDQVRGGAGADHDEPLPRALAPVRIRAEPVGELVQAALGRAPRALGELGTGERLLQSGQG